MSPPLRASNEGLLRPRVARAQGTHRAIPGQRNRASLDKSGLGRSLWPCPGQGASWRTRVGWVKVAILSILREFPPVVLIHIIPERFCCNCRSGTAFSVVREE